MVYTQTGGNGTTNIQALPDQGPQRGELLFGLRHCGNRKERVLEFSQHLYVKTIAERFEVVKTSICPAVAGSVPLSKENEYQTKAEAAEMRGTYREAVWTSTMTRPDIVDAIHKVAKFCGNPGPAVPGSDSGTWAQVGRSTSERATYVSVSGLWSRHLLGQHALGVKRGNSTGGSLNHSVLKEQQDDFVGIRCREHCFGGDHEGGFMYWSSSAIRPAECGRRPRQEFEGNQATLKLANIPVRSKRPRYIDVKHHLDMDVLMENMVYIVYLGTEGQHADMLTGPLNATRYLRSMSELECRFGDDCIDWRMIANQVEILGFITCTSRKGQKWGCTVYSNCRWHGHYQNEHLSKLSL